MRSLNLVLLFSIGISVLLTDFKRENTQLEENVTSDSVITSDSQDVLHKFIVGIYIAPPLNHTTDSDYKAIHDANVDLIQDNSENLPDSDKIYMLKMAATHGLKMIVANYRMNGTYNDIVSMIDIFHQYPATVGYYVQDEPLPSELLSAANKYNEILSLDPSVWPHVNLFPNNATRELAGVNYIHDYVEKWINLVGAQNLKYLSIDNYPYVVHGKGDNGGMFRWNDYFQNLDVVRQLGLKYHIRTSAYLQSIGLKGRLRRPDTNELRFSAYSVLAYGITLPIWFTYWRPNYNFTDAIVDTDGNKTDLYQPFKRINYEMRQLGRTLINLQAIDVYHTGQSIPDSTLRPPSGFVLNVADTINDSTIITNFLDPVENRTYIMVVNKSLTESKLLIFKIANNVLNIKRISKQTGNPESTNYSSSTHTFSDTFLPGEGKLYYMKN